MTDDDTFLLVLNPMAGSGRAGHHRAELEAALRRAGAPPFETAQTSGRGDATRIVRDALRSGIRGIAAVGGDGTMNEIVNGFFDEQGEAIMEGAWFGPLPFATGGDFCRGLGVPRGLEAMVQHFRSRRSRAIDVGWLDFIDHEGRSAHHAFVNIASCGMGGLVDLMSERGPKWLGGRLSFLVATLRAMARYRQPSVRITIDDRPALTTPIVNLTVANGRFFGGGMEMAPRALLDDGLFDVVTAEGMTVLQQLRLLGPLYRGDIEGRPGVRYERGRRVYAEPVDPEELVFLDIDGEPLGVLPATFTLRPAAVHLRA